MGTHPIFESDFDCLTASKKMFSRLFARTLTRAVPALMIAGTGICMIQPAHAEQCEMPLNTVSAKSLERTFIAIKPDGVQRGLVGEIVKRFEQKGFKLVAIKMVRARRTLRSTMPISLLVLSL